MSLMSGVSKWTRRALLVALVFALSAQVHAQDSKPFSNEQLDQMTAQIALYPDSLLAQLLMATTYPDQFALATAWSKAHPDAKGDEAVKMVENEPWDPSVASMVAFPEVVITLGEKPEWVKNMGDAFLAQPEDVMDSVQRLRQKAQQAGNLKSNEQVKVSTQAPEPRPAAASPTTVVQQSAPPSQVIVIEPAQPSVVYVPAYNPAVVYGTWPYPAYPPYYYPPPAGYFWSGVVATGIAWGVGIGISNALWGGCNWGRGDVNINVNRYNNINTNRRLDVNGGRTNWNHNPANRQTAYRGGDAARQNLDRKYQSGNREQFRGRDGGGAASVANRDASRERASQAMQSRGIESPGGSARDRAQAMNRDTARGQGGGANRDAARQQVQGADRDAARQRAQSASRDNALRGANSGQARAQVDRGAASRASAQSFGGGSSARTGGGGAARAGGGGGARPAGGGGGARAGGGGGHRGGGGRR
jgi:Protein of unknown function (DUF3300)